MFESKKWLLVLCIAIPLVVGGISAWISGNSMQTFESLNQPPLSPPGWLFPVVWTCLYVLMGVASWLILFSGEETLAVRRALTIYGVQLAVNFFWPIFFFRFALYLFSFYWLLLLWVLIVLTMLAFAKLRRPAAWCLAPYLIWVTFAGYLNWGIYILN